MGPESQNVNSMIHRNAQGVLRAKSTVLGLPCGFCGALVISSWQCPGCGCWWNERNFSFGGVFHRLTNAKKDLNIIRDPALAFAGVYVEVVWDGYDEDDSQGREIASMEPGWYLGHKLYS